jgi:hypothetical protein
MQASLLFVEHFICFLVHLPFVLCFLFVYGPGQPLPFVMDTVDSFPLMTTCRYILTLHPIVSEQWPDHPLSWHCALHQADLICHLPFIPSLGLVTSYMYIYSPVQSEPTYPYNLSILSAPPSGLVLQSPCRHPPL